MTDRQVIAQAEAYIHRIARDESTSRATWSRALAIVCAVEDSANIRRLAAKERELRREERAEIERIKRKYGA
jgi:hypothetical protein